MSANPTDGQASSASLTPSLDLIWLLRWVSLFTLPPA
jgi:hypothetical protein